MIRKCVKSCIAASQQLVSKQRYHSGEEKFPKQVQLMIEILSDQLKDISKGVPAAPELSRGLRVGINSPSPPAGDYSQVERLHL